MGTSLWGIWERSRSSTSPGIRVIRIVGLIVIAALAWRAATAEGSLIVFGGVLFFAAVVWLAVSGFFGYGDAQRSDWVGLVPFAVALVVREVFAHHSVQEIELQFARGPIGRHSVVYPLLQMFFLPLVRDPHSFVMHMNGVLGAVACLSLYLFTRQRLESRRAGFLCALFLATHPLLARFSPTDGPYALLLASWFSGLALLSAPRLDGWGLLGGALLVGMAATARMEGATFLIASLLMLDARALIQAARRHRVFAVAAFLAVYGQVAVQMVILLPFYIIEVRKAPTIVPVPIRWLYEFMKTPEPYAGSWLLSVLIGTGTLFALLPPLRLGLTAYVAMIVVLLPVAGSWLYGSALHKMMPAYALQTIVAGIGAYSLAVFVPERTRWGWLPVVPGVVAAFFVLVEGRAELTKPYLFTDEYDLVRSHLSPGGVPVKDCTLLTLNVDLVGDLDIHDFSQVVPDVRVLNCRRSDCLGELARGGCFYYVRSAACYHHVDGVPPECAKTGMTADGNRLACLNPTSRSFEQSIELEPIELRTIDIFGSFPDRRHYSPLTAEIGLFRARGKNGSASAQKAEVSSPSGPEKAFDVKHEASMPNPGPPVGQVGDEPSIPAGQDDLLLAMLGGSNVLSGNCKLGGAISDHGNVEATYTCPAGDVVIQLAHPSKATAESIRTARFAVTPLRGSAPRALLDALRSLIEARESAFQWQMLPAPVRSPAMVPLAISGAVGVFILALVLRRPRTARPIASNPGELSSEIR